MTAATLPVPTAAAKAKSRNAKRSARRLRAAKAALPSTARPAAKKPRKAVTVDSLSWSKTQGATDQLAFDAEGGGMDLEEVDDVQVVYGEPDEEGRRSVRFVTANAAVSSPDDGEVTDGEEEWIPASSRQNEATSEDDEAAVEDYKRNVKESKTRKLDTSPIEAASLPAYTDFALHSSLKRAIHRLGFITPTEIQQQSWRTSLAEGPARDIVGVAETGSGKTLAYGLPILNDILSRLASPSPSTSTDNSSLSALILAPTRELALQVKSHLSDAVAAACEPDSEGHLPVNIVAITGGMSIQKQKRMLGLGRGGQPDIIVATPGRLWDLVEQDRGLAKAIKRMRYLVLDEADRMVEQGHFAELDRIVGLVSRQGNADDAYEDDFAHATDSLDAMPPRDDLRTYVFSATMSKDLQRNLKRATKGKRRQPADEKGSMGALGDLLDKLDFRDADPLVIDLTSSSGLASRLRECKIDCFVKEKDIYLYYFLLRYPGRTLVFLSAIDGIRRLQPLLTVLGLEVGVLHSGMQQRARLKSLDRFRSKPDGILLATDVAARGLDIPSVSHVVHFQLPRSADVYVHRSGRTARAGKEGLSLVLCSPEEKGLQKSILRSLERDVELDNLPVEHSILDQLQRRLKIAHEIDKEQHKVTKANSDEKWMRDAAEAMEVDLSDDMSEDEVPRKRGKARSKAARKAAAGLEALKAQLREELARPLVVKGISQRYLTSFAGAQAGFVDSLVDESNHDKVLGMKRGSALTDVRQKKRSRSTAR